jgi:2-oxoglutarate dehydrogenase E1 component
VLCVPSSFSPCFLQVPLAKLKDSFNDGTSIAYIEELEQRYKADPSSVDKTWGMFFKALGECAEALYLVLA